MENYYYPTAYYYPSYREAPLYHDQDQRFFPFLLPAAFLAGGLAGGLAGLATSSWFNRPFYPPYPIGYPGYGGMPGYAGMPGYMGMPGYGYAGMPALQQPYSTAQALTTENINIYTR